MADVLIVCVREDETQAKALADMFEAAGFSVGGAPSNDAGLRSSGAGVVVWSQASIRSRPFLDAAQRVINAGKGVLACLIEPPPPDSVNDSPAFDLTGWTGDANDPSLDSLFFAVDRMVNNARAAVGASARPEPETYENPNMRISPQNERERQSAPSYSSRSRTAPPAAQPPQPSLPPGFQTRITPPSRAPASDPLGGEAEHWRSIRHSKDPTDFLDYLARYGPEGAFSELAEFRLKQLESNQPASLRDAARSAASEPARSYEPPPRRRAEPTRSYDAPPSRRPDPPPVRLEPTRAEPPPRRRPSYNDDYRPPIDSRDAPKKEGGFLRMLVLIVLLGGGVVAAGVYFGVGDRLQSITGGSSAAARDSTAPLQAASTEPAAAPAYASPQSDTPPAQVVGFGPQSAPATPPRPRPTQLASNTPRTQEHTEQQGVDPALNRAATPQVSWSNTPSTPASAGSGPLSLTGGSSSGQVTPQPISPTQLASANPPPTITASPPPSVVWTQRASAERLAANYPNNALRDHVGGNAQLDCVVRGDYGVTCFVASESPASAGFGRAALSIVSTYRARATLSDGSSAAGAHTRVSITFRPPADE